MAMEYFDLFGISPALQVDRAKLSRRFFELSRQYHPDYHIKATAAEQQEVLEKSALLNKAWKTFGDPDALIRYVLMEKGLLAEEEKYELAPAFLAEVMDINEALMDADDPAAVAALQEQIDELETKIYTPVKALVENYRENDTPAEALLQVKEWYFRKKYLSRIRQQLAGMS